MKGLYKLLFRYIFENVENLFFLLFFPFIIFGIMGEATIFSESASSNNQEPIAKSFVAGVSITEIIASGMFLIPITIVDFKKSVLLKRIGATNVKSHHFMLTILLLFFIQSMFSFFYVRIIATLLYGWRLDHWNFAFPSKLYIGIAWSLLTMGITIAIALVLCVVTKNVRQTTTVANLIYFPISILSGGMIPIKYIYDSIFLRSINYINPFKYSLEPYFNSQGVSNLGYNLDTWQLYVFPIISVIIIIMLLTWAIRKFKWTT